MKFFTPELLDQANQNDWKLLADSMDAWERKAMQYREHLKSIRRKLKKSARQLSESFLHDAHIVSVGPADSKKYGIILRHGEYLLVILYSLTGKPRLKQPQRPPSFASKGGLSWLYDEIDTHRSALIHRILLSTGAELHIPFDDVSLNILEFQRHESPSPATAARPQRRHASGGAARRGAASIGDEEGPEWISYFGLSDISILDNVIPAVTADPLAREYAYPLEIESHTLTTRG